MVSVSYSVYRVRILKVEQDQATYGETEAKKGHNRL